jgi:hypothetical protein
MPYQSIIVTPEFLDSLTRLSQADQRRILRALLLLDADERHPSLNVHRLKGKESPTCGLRTRPRVCALHIAASTAGARN